VFLRISTTCVIARAPMFPLYEVVPGPAPKAPASVQPKPSIAMPLLIASLVGGGAPDILHQQIRINCLQYLKHTQLNQNNVFTIE